MRSTNFIPSYRRDLRLSRRRRRAWTVALTTYAVVLAAGSLMTWTIAHKRPEDLAAATDQTIQQTQRVRHTAGQMRADLRRDQTALLAARTLADQPDWSILLAAVGNQLGDNVFLARLELAPASLQALAPADDQSANAYQLSLTGFARDQMAISQFAVRLETLGIFDHVKVRRTQRQTLLADTAVAFDLDCSMGQPEEVR
ncbi:MAG: hypothetical protein ACYTFO_04345 [Planctomycetota bacterium]